MYLLIFKFIGWVWSMGRTALSLKLEDYKGTVLRGAIGTGTSVGVASAATKVRWLEFFQAVSIVGGAIVVILTAVSLAITVAWKMRNFCRPPRDVNED